MKIVTHDSDVVLEDDLLSLKITSDRRLYKKWDGWSTYRYAGRKVERGLSKSEKESLLLSLRQKAYERMEEGGEVIPDEEDADEGS